MNTTFQIAGLMGLACLAIAAFQRWWLQRQHGRHMERQHHRHLQQQQAAGRHLEQAKRQIEQLQHDLAAARLQVKRLSSGAVGVAEQQARVRALHRVLDEAAQASSSRLPPDGFADTLPSPQYPEYLALLTTR